MVWSSPDLYKITGLGGPSPGGLHLFGMDFSLVCGPDLDYRPHCPSVASASARATRVVPHPIRISRRTGPPATTDRAAAVVPCPLSSCSGSSTN